jgi:hypothetical protein
MECYDLHLAAALQQIFADKVATATPLRLDDLRSRPLLITMRDRLCRLFLPYL